jgi:hypothetical protein
VQSWSIQLHSTEGTGTLAVIPSALASFNFPPPRQTTAMFAPINVHYDAWSENEAPTVYALRDQQCIVNWTGVRGLTFSEAGLQYINCLRLYHTSDRAIAIGDNLVFLYCPRCDFTPEQPCRTLFSVSLSNNLVQCIILIEWIYCTTLLTLIRCSLKYSVHTSARICSLSVLMM